MRKSRLAPAHQRVEALTSAPYLAVCSCQSRARAFSVAAILDLIVKMSSLMRRSPEKGDVQSADSVTYVRKKLAVCGHAKAGLCEGFAVKMHSEAFQPLPCRRVKCASRCSQDIGDKGAHLWHRSANEVDCGARVVDPLVELREEGADDEGSEEDCDDLRRTHGRC